MTRAAVEYFGRLLETKYRLLIPLLIIVLTKIVAGAFLFNTLNMATKDTYWMTVPWNDLGQNSILREIVSHGNRLPFLFLGWDSAWYLSIATKGYVFSTQSFAFFPGLPGFTWLLNVMVYNPVYVMIAFALIVGALCIPVFQLVAEQYMKKSTALIVTLLFASFSYVFLFTTVAYSEGLFLFSTLCAWYFFKKENLLATSLSASVATLARPPGILILLPIMIEFLRKRRGTLNLRAKRNFVYLSLPFLSFFAWLLYCKSLGNDWFAFGNRAAWDVFPSFRSLILDVLPKSGTQGFFDVINNQWPFSFVWVPFVLLTPILIYAAIKLDKSLAAYSAVYVFAVLLGGAVYSIPRLYSFCFPVWLALGALVFKHRKLKFAVPIILVVFCVVGVYLWLNFLNGTFIP